MPAKRLLLVTRNLPPLVGGMERLNWHMAAQLARRNEVHVIGPEGSAALGPPSVRIIEVALKPLPRFLAAAFLATLKEARSMKPDVVLAGSGLTAPIAFAAAKSCGAASSAYVHGLDIVVPNRLYRAAWLPAIRRLDRVVANSRATADACRVAGVSEGRISITNPGVEMPGRDNDPALEAAFRARHALGDRPLLLSVGRITERKGLQEFVKASLPAIAAAHPDVVLLVVGDEPSQALHAKSQPIHKIRQIADAEGIGGNLKLLGQVSDEELDLAYRVADVHIFPVREIPGDPEGFGMVALEAAARGLPTVAFSVGGITDAVVEGRNGYLVPAGDYARLSATVLKVLSMRNALREACLSFAKAGGWSEFGANISRQLGVDHDGLPRDLPT